MACVWLGSLGRSLTVERLEIVGAVADSKGKVEESGRVGKFEVEVVKLGKFCVTIGEFEIFEKSKFCTEPE